GDYEYTRSKTPSPKGFQMKSRVPALAALALLPLALSFAPGCRNSAAETKDLKPEAAAPIAVKQVAAAELKVPRQLTLSGTLIGSEEAKVAAGAAGKVLATHIERGSVVRKGALLV